MRVKTATKMRKLGDLGAEGVCDLYHDVTASN